MSAKEIRIQIPLGRNCFGCWAHTPVCSMPNDNLEDLPNSQKTHKSKPRRLMSSDTRSASCSQTGVAAQAKPHPSIHRLHGLLKIDLILTFFFSLCLVYSSETAGDHACQISFMIGSGCASTGFPWLRSQQFGTSKCCSVIVISDRHSGRGQG